MASDRDAAKGAASGVESSDPQLGIALSDASKFRIDLLKEQHSQARKMASGERGLLGLVFGGKDHAPSSIAFVAAAAGLGIGAWCLVRAKAHGADPEFWAKQGERGFAFAGTALGYIFGRGSKG